MDEALLIEADQAGRVEVGDQAWSGETFNQDVMVVEETIPQLRPVHIPVPANWRSGKG